jgi:hypothetical protein
MAETPERVNKPEKPEKPTVTQSGGQSNCERNLTGRRSVNGWTSVFSWSDFPAGQPWFHDASAYRQKLLRRHRSGWAGLTKDDGCRAVAQGEGLEEQSDGLK